VIGLVVSFGAGESWVLLGTAGTVIGALLLSGGVIGPLDVGFAGLTFTAILLLVLAVVIHSGFLISPVPLAVAGALGSNTVYVTYILMVTERTIKIVFLLCCPLRLISSATASGRPMRGLGSSLPVYRWSQSISGSGSARCGATIRAVAGR
jgi:hypothetical protein